MKTLCWNCQGVGNTLTVRHLGELVGRYLPQVLFLSETKQNRAHLEGLCDLLGFYNLYTVEPSGIGGGLALLWKEEVAVTILDSCNRFIDSKVHWQGQDFFITGIYGDLVRAERPKVWERLIRISLNRSDPWLLLGDFNEITHNSEKQRGAPRNESSFIPFRDMLNSCDLSEPCFQGNDLSWYGIKYNELVQCKLDRVMANSEWHNLFLLALSYYLTRVYSDHSPIITLWNGKANNKHGYFRFDPRWKSKPGFAEAVHQGWIKGQPQTGDVVSKLANYRAELARWKKGTKTNSEQLIWSLKDKIHKVTQGINFSPETLLDLKKQLHAAEREEE